MPTKMLTAREVEHAKPAATRRELSDGGSGLYLTVQPSGKKSWAYRYRYKGVPRKLTIGKCPPINLADARELATELSKAVAAGRDPAFEKREKRERGRDLVRDVGDSFIEVYARPRNRSWKLMKRALELHAYPVIGKYDLSAVTRRDILDVLDRANEVGPSAANYILAVMRRMFGWAVERDIIELSPCNGVKPPNKKNTRDRVLTDDELIAFMRACDRMDDTFGKMFKLLLLTAARRNEVSAAPWSEFDLEGTLWTIPAERAKNGVVCEMPLSAQAVTILESLPTYDKDDRLFPSADPESAAEGKTATGFGRAKRRLDKLMLEELQAIAKERGGKADKVILPDWVLHDLRRSAASGMARLGIGIHIVERLLNHVTGASVGGIVAVYQRHDFRKEKEAAVTAWANFLDSLLAPSTKVVRMRPRGA
jgi:integrase